MNQEIKFVIGDWEIFLDNIIDNLKKSKFSIGEFKELDHIAYRTEDLETYEKIKNSLVDFSEKYNDKLFNGRSIFVCKLKNPLIYKEFVINGIEVLAPKENNTFKNGLEHAEFVTIDALEEFKKKHDDILFNLRAYNREENPELVVEFQNCACKFHAQSILEIRGLSN